MIRVALIDNGILKEEIGRNSIIKEVNFSQIKEENSEEEILGLHGTICASLIKEICPQVEFLDIKITNTQDKFSPWILLQALRWCEKERLDIINMSLGGVTQVAREEIQESIFRLRKKNVIIVAACDKESYNAVPACLEGVISVACGENGEYRVEVPECEVSRKLGLYIQEKNSFAAPVITGYIANYLTLFQCGVKKNLNEYLICQTGVIRNKKELCIPVIRLNMGNEEIEELLFEFRKQGFYTRRISKQKEIRLSIKYNQYDIVFIDWEIKLEEELVDGIIEQKATGNYQLLINGKKKTREVHCIQDLILLLEEEFKDNEGNKS